MIRQYRQDRNKAGGILLYPPLCEKIQLFWLNLLAHFQVLAFSEISAAWHDRTIPELTRPIIKIIGLGCLKNCHTWKQVYRVDVLIPSRILYSTTSITIFSTLYWKFFLEAVRGNKCTQIGKEDIKLCLSADDITVYVRNHNESWKRLLELISDYHKVAGYKTIIKSNCFLGPAKSKWNLKLKSNTVYISNPQNKILGINITKLIYKIYMRKTTKHLLYKLN